jgi:hypothetical protein
MSGVEHVLQGKRWHFSYFNLGSGLPMEKAEGSCFAGVRLCLLSTSSAENAGLTNT